MKKNALLLLVVALSCDSDDDNQPTPGSSAPSNINNCNKCPPPTFEPRLTTSPVIDITDSKATSGGTIVSDSGYPITARGVVWSLSGSTTITGDVKADAGTGNFVVAINGLRQATTYSLKAYATNSKGTGYGATVTFTTRLPLPQPGPEVVDADGNSYHSVIIGTQVWLTENLKVTKFNDGSVIPFALSNTETINMTTPVVKWYDDDLKKRDQYGAIYNWYAVNTQKLCPIGWHVPSDNEWTTLTEYAGGEQSAGGRLKEAGTSHWKAPNAGGSNESGFTAIPQMNQNPDGSLEARGEGSIWWSSTDNIPTAVFPLHPAPGLAWYRVVGFNSPSIGRSEVSKGAAVVVRCVKD